MLMHVLTLTSKNFGSAYISKLQVMGMLKFFNMDVVATLVM